MTMPQAKDAITQAAMFSATGVALVAQLAGKKKTRRANMLAFPRCSNPIQNATPFTARAPKPMPAAIAEKQSIRFSQSFAMVNKLT